MWCAYFQIEMDILDSLDDGGVGAISVFPVSYITKYTTYTKIKYRIMYLESFRLTPPEIELLFIINLL